VRSFLCLAFPCFLPEAPLTQVVTKHKKHLQALPNMVVENGCYEVNLPDWYSPFLRGKGDLGQMPSVLEDNFFLWPCEWEELTLPSQKCSFLLHDRSDFSLTCWHEICSVLTTNQHLQELQVKDGVLSESACETLYEQLRQPNCVLQSLE
jgi:hypothetical protein